MKKLLVIATLALVTLSGYSQGLVTFANGTPTAITNSPGTGLRVTVNVGLYGSTTLGLGQNDSSLSLVGVAGATFAPGLFSLGNRTIGAVPGDTVTLQVRAWSGTAADYAAAVLARQTDPTILLGKSTVWEQPTGGGTLGTPAITGAGRLQPFFVTAGVPEPSSIALGLLGLGAITLFRRRK